MAAGLSSRLGRPKALVRVQGVSLLRRTLELLEPVARPFKIVVVVPPRSIRYRLEFDPRKVDFVVNPRRHAGLSTSVRAGVRRAWCSAGILLVPVDLVALDASDIVRLVSHWRASRRRVVARRIGDYPGTPLILPRALYRDSLRVSGGTGLRNLAATLRADRVRLVNLASAEADLDNPSDLKRARRFSLRGGGPWRGTRLGLRRATPGASAPGATARCRNVRLPPRPTRAVRPVAIST